MISSSVITSVTALLALATPFAHGAAIGNAPDNIHVTTNERDIHVSSDPADMHATSNDALLTPASEAIWGGQRRSVPTSKRFDLTQPSYDLYRNMPLQDVTVQQGFAFDNTNRRLFVSQLRSGSAESSGNLCITQLDFHGNYLGYMYLEGFGHGIALGAQAVGSDTYLWVEVDPTGAGYGKRLGRFKFVNKSTLSGTSNSVQKFTPFTDAAHHTCSIDPVNNRLVVRYDISGVVYIAVFDLDAATKGDFSKPLTNIKQPSLPTLGERFQGYAAYGEFLYVLTGDSYVDSGNVINSEVTCISLNTGGIVQGPVLTKAGSTLTFREPEGLAIYQTVDGEVRLFLGFASGDPGDRRSNLFYKNALI